MVKSLPLVGGGRRTLILALTGGVIGMGVNLYAPELLAGITPGRLVSLPVALAAGPFWGVLAALISCGASGPGLLPVRFLVEAAVLGFAARRGWSALLTGAVFWAITTAGLYLLGQYGAGDAMTVARTLRSLLAMMVVVALADALYTAAGLSRFLRPTDAEVRRRPLRAYLFHTVILAATVPLLSLNFVGGRLVADRQEVDAAARLREAAQAIANDVDTYVSWHVRAMVTLDETLTRSGDPTEVEPWLAHYGRTYEGFRSLFVVDAAGTMIGQWNVPPVATRRIGEYQDIEFFKTVNTTGQPFVTGVRRGTRGRNVSATVAMPLRTSGFRDAVLAGNLLLSRFDRFALDYESIADATITIVDRSNRVVYSSFRATKRWPTSRIPHSCSPQRALSM
jgi:hypothetical protein